MPFRFACPLCADVRQVEGIPTLVILDAKTGNVITTVTRSTCACAVPTGDGPRRTAARSCLRTPPVPSSPGARRRCSRRKRLSPERRCRVPPTVWDLLGGVELIDNKVGRCRRAAPLQTAGAQGGKHSLEEVRQEEVLGIYFSGAPQRPQGAARIRITGALSQRTGAVRAAALRRSWSIPTTKFA